MSEKTFTRSRFLGGAAGGIGLVGLLGFSGEASGSVAESVNQLPEGFSYAPGTPVPVKPVKEVKGIIQSVNSEHIVLQVGSELEAVPLAEKPFVWKNGIVNPRQAKARLKKGESAIISGNANEAGEYVDIQHVWVNLTE